MEVTRESSSIRWLIMAGAWAVVATIAVLHQNTMRAYVALLDGIGQPAAAHATPLGRPLPANFADAQTWVRYALAAEAKGQWQVRFTDADNAPKGREVHWNSAFARWIGFAGRIQHAATGEPLPQAVESALAWMNLPLLLGCVIGFSAWAAARAGAGAGVLVALGIVGLNAFYDGFAPNYVDHHGLLTAAVFGTVLGAVFMGAGWWRSEAGGPGLLPASPAAARRGAVVSALSAAAGMWISAASTIPAIAFVGLAGLGATMLSGRGLARNGGTFDPGLWRIWGRTGAIACLVFYALEYAPGHLGLRLEVNHPFYASAWWGGSEVVALVSAWWLQPATGRPAPIRWLAPALALAAAPVTVLVGGAAVFLVRDPFVGELRHTVAEGMSFGAAAQAFGTAYAQQYLLNFILVGASGWVLLIARGQRLILSFAALVALGFVLLACWEIRWWLVGAGPMLCLLVVMVAALGRSWKPLLRWGVILAVGALLLPLGALSRVRLQQENLRRHMVDASDVLQPLYRDMAVALRASQPQGEIVLLAGPDASSGVGYFGQFKAVGTLYWENVDGLKAAAAIYCAGTDPEAQQLIRARGITHLAMVSRGNYLPEYFRLYRPDAPPGDIEKTFGHRLFVRQQLPRWLRMIPYRVPAPIATPDLNVLLFQVVPEQSEIDAAWNLGTALLGIGVPDGALRNFRQALALAAPAQRATLAQTAGDLAFNQNLETAAIPLYRLALESGPNPASAAKLAWLLATSPLPAVRQGRDALAVIEPVARANANQVMVLDAYSAALAENGRFAEAAEIAGRAIALAQGAGDTASVGPLQQRMAAYRAGRPWRR